MLTPAPLRTTLLLVMEMSFLSRKRPGGTATVTPVPLAASLDAASMAFWKAVLESAGGRGACGASRQSAG